MILNIFQELVFSDECLFLTNGTLNQHNARIWGAENPQAVEEEPMRSEKVMVWCTMNKNRSMGLISFAGLMLIAQHANRCIGTMGYNKCNNCLRRQFSSSMVLLRILLILY